MKKEINTIKKAKLINENGRLYVDLTIINDNEHSTKEIHIPRIVLPILENSQIVFRNDGFGGCSIDFGMGELTVEPVDDLAYSVNIIKEKAKEMTISEIERKLGYKIKIVGEEK